MEMRQLGQSNLQIAPLVFGGNVFGWTADEATSHRLLDMFVAAGFNAIDTADVYSIWADGHQGGESETIIGTWLKKRGGRDNVIIATKVGMDMGGGSKGLSKAYIMKAVEASLRRLQTDHIDLYFSHRDDDTVSQAETLEAYAHLVEQGKIRVIGASNFSAGRLTEALDLAAKQGYPRYEVVQPCYNLYDRSEYEGELQQLCLQRQLGMISYFSLASGFLTGKYRSKQDLQGRERGEDVEKYLDARGQRILQALDDVAAKHSVTPAQVALAWLLKRRGLTAPIASATGESQLQQLLAGAQLDLDDKSVRQLTEAGE
ncbi:aldo/keto reductase [Dongia soli]|uniref:Aldo/keto reductase n=1 Tax=Dongia soli TaxID=600628 RepID=A0ABU5EEC9_9PROT|nr:aldo/keto reductase [Dongia soli]MDY0884430.1 aldo/keto reductase [Dongia soli]